jgi:hypothetical protein
MVVVVVWAIAARGRVDWAIAAVWVLTWEIAVRGRGTAYQMTPPPLWRISDDRHYGGMTGVRHRG